MKANTGTLTRLLGKKMLETKANSPHIFFALGVVGVIGGAVLACKATLKLENEVDEIKNNLEEVKSMAKEVKQNSKSEYSDQDYYKDMGFVYAGSTIKIAKLYTPAVVVGGLGIALLTGSHIQLTKRNAALTVTLTALTKAYQEYRVRVQDELGTEKERDIYYGVKEETVEVDGKKKVEKVVDPNKLSPYMRIFDEYSRNWQKDPEINKVFIECQQTYANRKLQIRGHMLLNDVYDLLGMDRTTAGAVVGWLYKGDGDNYIDFNLYTPENARFLNGHERSVILDFNVDGVVYDKI